MRQTETKKLKQASHGLQGKLVVPGDKSISHRAIMLGSLAQGTTTIKNILQAEDVQTTMRIYRQLGVSIETKGAVTRVVGKGAENFQEPVEALDFGNSGTTLRLSLGILACQPFAMQLIGDASLSSRPMGRVLEPLKQMGLKLAQTTERLPIALQANRQLEGIHYTMPIASAQVKSALILAALQAETPSVIHEPIPTRDHTEKMLEAFGVTLQRQQQEITIMPRQQLTATQLEVPGDFSSAAFFIVAALLVPDSMVILPQVGLNPTRLGLLHILNQMGAKIALPDVAEQVGEPLGTLEVTSQNLQATTIEATEIPSMIDEIPLLVLAATQANGTTVITGASELHHKETDRIETVTQELNRLGAHVVAQADGFVVEGPTPLQVEQPTVINSHGDHRIGMMLAVAALITQGDVYLQDADAVNISYPQFFADLDKLLN
ncbi:3-phosphoshikimate 1-carboxyvinyltransferase [Weissella uvarum]|uniref:3-phosphoshikimate 1-carboxyvinyltransferase n=1 Tax=Weissella uvarum TaxID=1479233 RepID=UPI0019612063|nr:3-phosphoshikimate 1-carboxyvinyltransferase [Weissella uvarum]MBM7617169.1 3-phosphoshikimate 1-carboxyvinyltransferase [Weissella uvarum]MCM0595465.1 3-phosphoshikimate 1-carboxyvinyltransferase [Weissella uvarum]